MSADITFRFVAPREGTWNFTLSQTVSTTCQWRTETVKSKRPTQKLCTHAEWPGNSHRTPRQREQVIYLAVDGVDLRGAARDGAFLGSSTHLIMRWR